MLQRVARRCTLCVASISRSVLARRHAVTLVESMQRAAGDASLTGDALLTDADRAQLEVDEQVPCHFAHAQRVQGSPFKSPYIISKTPPMTRFRIQRMVGNLPARTPRARPDIYDRMQVRRPRAEDMDPADLDWPTVWPTARSFRSSVVPLPVRMSSRKNPERRAPMAARGNLELVKIPNFLHLTPKHVKRHCEAIKKFCTSWPVDLDAASLTTAFPLTISYSDYVHQGTSLRDMRARIVTVSVKLAAMELDSASRDKLIRLAGWRYSPKDDVLTIVTDRCYTRKQNYDYAMYLLTALYHESQKREQWEEMKEAIDSRHVQFPGSRGEAALLDLVHRVTRNLPKTGRDEERLPPVVRDIVQRDSQTPGDERPERDAVLRHPSVEQFVRTWTKLRNEPETPEATRQYAASVRELLGIPAVFPDSGGSAPNTSDSRASGEGESGKSERQS